jgi:hypothetical protein
VSWSKLQDEIIDTTGVHTTKHAQKDIAFTNWKNKVQVIHMSLSNIHHKDQGANSQACKQSTTYSHKIKCLCKENQCKIDQQAATTSIHIFYTKK